MSRLLRSAGAAALIALALLVVPGADRAMAAAPSVTIDSPVADTTQQAAFAITGSTHQDGSDAVILSVKVKLSDDDGWLAPVEQNYVSGGSSNSPIFSGGGATVSYNWANIVPKYNGPYTVTVTATGEYRPPLQSPTSSSSIVSKSFHVEIAPSTPTGVAASKPEDSSAVNVTWKQNPESDIAGYVVYRSYAGDAGKQVGSVDGTKFAYSDDLGGKAPGQYKYAIQAVRHARSCKSTSNTDEACSRGIAGKTSSYSSAVTLRSTPATTTTTIKKPPTGGGGGGPTTTRPAGTGGTGGTDGTGGTSGGTAGGTKPRSYGSGGFAPGGDVDLSKFGDLLNPKAGSVKRPGEAQGTYDPTLPYGERRPASQNSDDDTLITIGGASLPKPSDDWVKFIGAGSLATALLVHVLWFKQQVDALPLEPLTD